MANRLPSDAELDRLIDACLRGESLLPAPAGLHRKIQNRVCIAALKERERARFRNSLLSAVGAVVVILVGAAVVVTLTHFSHLYRHGVSGGKGFIDYYLTLLDVSWSGQVGAYALYLTLGLGMIALWAGLMSFHVQSRLPAAPTRSAPGADPRAGLRRAH